MKKLIFLITIGLALFTSCTGVKTVVSGLENEAFLEFVGESSKYSEGVKVNINDKTFFTAEVNKSKSDRPKGKVYAVKTGMQTITISNKNNIIYKKRIFVAAQETKKIFLP